MPTSPPLKLTLICQTALIETAVRLAAPEAELGVFPIEGSLTSENVLSVEGTHVVEAALGSDAALIEWTLDRAPELNTLCFHIRRNVVVPVFMLTGAGSDARIASIAAGADDALTFPLDASLLSAKILSYKRLVQAATDAEKVRTGGDRTVAADATHDVVRFGALRLDRSAHRFFIRDEEVELTPREHALIGFLIQHGEELCTRDSILDNVWGINFDTGTNMVDVYMYFLRRKLEVHGLSTMIETIRGRGYRLVLP